MKKPIYQLVILLALCFFTFSCDDDKDIPMEENDEEVITDIILKFTDTLTSDIVTARAQDPDGEGTEELVFLDSINLSANTPYILALEIINALDSNDIEDIGNEIAEENNEHQFFFGFTENAFASPTGEGNTDGNSDTINYIDTDEKGNSVGLKTQWTTGSALNNGFFKLKLQHLPGIKSSTSISSDGDTDINLIFVLNIN